MGNSHLPNLGIIGGGVMAEAVMSQLLFQEVCSPSDILVSDISIDRLSHLHNSYKVEVTDDNSRVARESTTLLLAIKPQVFDEVTSLLGPRTSSEQLVISILAGVPLARLEPIFVDQPVIRAMPNTPATVGAGITAIASGHHVQSHHLNKAQTLFAAVGEVVQVPESLMDAVTGLSGSGPAFVAIALEALTDGGVAAGLPRQIAAQLALQTMRGTTTLLQDTGMHPAELKDRVTSPGGTTIAGVTALEQSGFSFCLNQCGSSRLSALSGVGLNDS